MKTMVRKLALAAAAFALFAGAAEADCSRAALALVVDETVWPVALVGAKPQGADGAPATTVLLTFDDKSARTVAAVTSDNIGKTMGIENEGRILAEAVIGEPITAGQLAIAGTATETAAQLAESLCQ